MRSEPVDVFLAVEGFVVERCGTAVAAQQGELAVVPDWAADTEYFKALVADGKVVPSGKSDKQTQAAAEKKVRTRRGSATTEE